MFVKSQDGNRYINLEKVDIIEINPINNVICKINGLGYMLADCKSKENAQEFINNIFHNNDLIK